MKKNEFAVKKKGQKNCVASIKALSVIFTNVTIPNKIHIPCVREYTHQTTTVEKYLNIFRVVWFKLKNKK